MAYILFTTLHSRQIKCTTPCYQATNSNIHHNHGYQIATMIDVNRVVTITTSDLAAAFSPCRYSDTNIAYHRCQQYLSQFIGIGTCSSWRAIRKVRVVCMDKTTIP